MSPASGAVRLFDDVPRDDAESLAEGAVLLHGHAAKQQEAVWQAVGDVAQQAPFRHMITPGGFRMSVAMTNCGTLGWVTDRRGYRYSTVDPESGAAWPSMPPVFCELAVSAALRAGFPEFAPDACLINRYEPGAKMSLHQDKDELDLSAPIVSVSLGLEAMFLFGALTRKERPRRIPVVSGDVVVWGGPARLTYHGVSPLKPGTHPLTGSFRYNLTFRKTR